MALIKEAHSRGSIANAIVLDLGDLARQGEVLKARGRAEAEAIVSKARAEREEIIAGAEDQGQQRGFQRGLDEGTARGSEQGRAEAKEQVGKQLESLIHGWSTALAEFETVRDEMVIDAKQQILRIAAIVAQRVTHRVVELDETIVASQLEAVLSRVCRPSRLVVAINPEDEAIAREALPGIVAQLAEVTHADLLEDPEIQRGSCVVRTAGGGEIDGSIGTQIDRMVSVLLPRPGDDPEPESRP